MSQPKRLLFMGSLASVLTVAAVYVFIAVGLVPYWQSLSGTEVQAWFAGPFSRFAYMMLPVHLISIVSTIGAFWLHREGGSPRGLWTVALVTLLICQGFNFTLFGASFNLDLQSGELDAEAALAVLDSWDFYHLVRTASVCVSAVAMMAIGILPQEPS